MINYFNVHQGKRIWLSIPNLPSDVRRSLEFGKYKKTFSAQICNNL